MKELYLSELVPNDNNVVINSKLQVYNTHTFSYREMQIGQSQTVGFYWFEIMAVS